MTLNNLRQEGETNPRRHCHVGPGRSSDRLAGWPARTALFLG